MELKPFKYKNSDGLADCETAHILYCKREDSEENKVNLTHSFIAVYFWKILISL